MLPHFGVGYSFGTRVADGIIDDSLNAPSAWLGVTYYAHRARVSPMLQISAEFEHRVTPTDTSLTYIMPTARVGLGWLGCLDDTDTPNYESAWLPCATLYALGGTMHSTGVPDREPLKLALTLDGVIGCRRFGRRPSTHSSSSSRRAAIRSGRSRRTHRLRKNPLLQWQQGLRQQDLLPHPLLRPRWPTRSPASMASGYEIAAR